MKRWVPFISLSLLWGSSFILMKRGLDAFTPMQIAALRITIAGLVMVPFILGKAKNVPKKAWPFILIIGILGNAIPAFLFPLAETKINSSSTGILNVMSPVFTLILGVMFFGFRFKKTQNYGVFVGFLGALILLLMGGGEVNVEEHIFYSLLVIFATVLYGLSTNITKRYLQEVSPIYASGFALVFVSIPYWIYLLGFSDILSVFQTNEYAWASLGYISILAALGTSLALVLFYYLVQQTSTIFSASVTYIIPIVALAWGLLDGETFSPWELFGMFVIMLGVYLVNSK
ncbi:MAG: DMT family transporter [Bacteroidia bacterium]|nr:DMT family transporter [Bacteroidia bacterium]